MPVKLNFRYVILIALIALTVVGVTFFIPFVEFKIQDTKAILTKIQVKRNILHLGKTKRGQPIKASFLLTNCGDADLVITEVRPDCHCTIADWKKEPIKPRDSTLVVATFDAASLGFYQKNILVTCNAINSPMLLTFRVEVIQ